jgi:hypothetical protein
MKPMIIDVKHDRRTVPTSSGKSYPVLFGAGATSMLMYIALNPGAQARDIQDTLEIDPGRFQSRIERLQDMRLVIGKRWYQINPDVAHQHELVRFLCQYGEAIGMARGPNARGRRTPDSRVDPIQAPMPPDLFGTKARTNILLMVAALQETYMFELHKVLGLCTAHVGPRLKDLAVEGVLSVRTVKRVKCYSLNPDLPCAEPLKHLLRRWACNRTDIVSATNMALLRRLEVERAGTNRERSIFKTLYQDGCAVGRIIKGVQRERPPIHFWRRLHGKWSNERWGRRVMKCASIARSTLRASRERAVVSRPVSDCIKGIRDEDLGHKSQTYPQ